MYFSESAIVLITVVIVLALWGAGWVGFKMGEG